jgi:hypothetical protein
MGNRDDSARITLWLVIRRQVLTYAMNISDELERLARLHTEGKLSTEEFALAKTRVLAQSKAAAGNYVTFSVFISVVLVLFALIIVFGVVLPRIRENHTHTFQIQIPQ